MTSNLPCVTGSPATSGSITMAVNPVLPASVSIAAVPAGAICAGTSVTFTATPTNGGTTPTYQWYNGATPIAGATSATYTSTTLANGDAINVHMTSNLPCVTGSPATSSTITMVVNPVLPASVSIAAVPAGAICAGTSVTFTATPTNGGTTPTYQWYNGATPIAGATSATYTSTTLANGDAINVHMTSNLPCVTGSPATSSTITMAVNPVLPASVNIAAAPAGAICAGTSVTFTATPTNGGAAPTYQWYNGATLIPGATSATYTSATLANGDAITVHMTSNLPCVTGSPATSNIITMAVNPVLPASVNIVAAPAGAICAGTSVTFTATPTNGGAAPTYQWYNGATLIPGATSVTYTSATLANGDAITVHMTSNLACVTGSPATSNIITMAVNPSPSAIATTVVDAACGFSNGSITLGAVTGGVAPYTYSVDGSPFTATLVYTNLAAASHPIDVRDANGCIFSTAVNISNTGGPTAIATTTTNETCGSANGTLTLGVVTGGVGPFTYSVDVSAYTATTSYTNLSAGAHSIDVKDANGCIFSTSVNISNTPGPSAIATTAVDAACGLSNGSITLGAVTGGVAP